MTKLLVCNGIAAAVGLYIFHEIIGWPGFFVAIIFGALISAALQSLWEDW